MAEAEKVQKIEFIPASKDINVLLIAPHGVKGDDDNTAELTRLMAEHLGCHAIINSHYKRAKKYKKVVIPADEVVDCNSIKQVRKAGLETDYLELIRATKNSILINNKPNPCYIFYIHGIEDKKIKLKAYSECPENQILIGIGNRRKGGESPLFCADKVKAEKLAVCLGTAGGTNTILSEIASGEKYAGWNPDNLVQLFNNPEDTEYYDREHVQSIQLEIQKVGFRDTADNIAKAATLLSGAIMELLKSENVPVEKPEEQPAQEDSKALVVAPDKSVVPAEDKTTFMLIAPHAHPDDDGPNIGVLARKMGELMGCEIIVNEEYKKTWRSVASGKRAINEAPSKKDKHIDWFNAYHAEQFLQEELINPIESTIKKSKNTIFVWLHKISDEHIAFSEIDIDEELTEDDREYKSYEYTSISSPFSGYYHGGALDNTSLNVSENSCIDKQNNKLSIIVGSEYSANYYSIFFLINYINNKSVKLRIIAGDGVSISGKQKQDMYGHPHYFTMNNWFRIKGYKSPMVQSVSFQIRETGCLDNSINIDKTAKILSSSLVELIKNKDEKEKDTSLIDRCYHAITTQFNYRFEQAMYEIGEYIIKEFYHDDINLARKGEGGVCKKLSLKGLIDKLSASHGAPKKTWIYNAVKLVAECHDIKDYAITNDKELNENYHKILLSQKLLLFPVKNLKKKAEYINKIVKEKLTVQQLREILGRGVIEHHPLSLVDIVGSPDKLFGEVGQGFIEDDALDKQELPVLQETHKRAEQKRDAILALAGKYDEFIQRLEAAEHKKALATCEGEKPNLDAGTGALPE